LITEETHFISKKDRETGRQLKSRQQEVVKLIEKKQERSKQEFEMKKEVLASSFKASVESLIKRIQKQKEIITSSYGPIVLNSKRIEKPIFDINKDLDPVGHKHMNEMNAMQDKVP
jgi:uncharacterized protein with gpF-like domain